MSEIAFSWSEMYGTIPSTAMIVTRPPSRVLLPYREAMKSAIEVMRFSLLMRMILRSTSQPSANINVGPR